MRLTALDFLNPLLYNGVYSDDCTLQDTPRALSARLNGSLSAACPSGLSLEYAHSIAPKSALLYSKKKNNELFRDFTHLCNIYTMNLRNGADELVQY